MLVFLLFWAAQEGFRSSGLRKDRVVVSRTGRVFSEIRRLLEVSDRVRDRVASDLVRLLESWSEVAVHMAVVGRSR